MADKSRPVRQSSYRLQMTNQINKFLIGATSKAQTPPPISDRYGGLTNGSSRASLSRMNDNSGFKQRSTKQEHECYTRLEFKVKYNFT